MRTQGVRSPVVDHQKWTRQELDERRGASGPATEDCREGFKIRSDDEGRRGARGRAQPDGVLNRARRSLPMADRAVLRRTRGLVRRDHPVGARVVLNDGRPAQHVVGGVQRRAHRHRHRGGEAGDRQERSETAAPDGAEHQGSE